MEKLMPLEDHTMYDLLLNARLDASKDIFKFRYSERKAELLRRHFTAQVEEIQQEFVE